MGVPIKQTCPWQKANKLLHQKKSNIVSIFADLAFKKGYIIC